MNFTTKTLKTNVLVGIQKFFEENTHGIIQTEALTVAIWEEQDRPGIIYMFDPNPCGPAGQHQNDGTACVLFFESPELAAMHFISNLPQAKRTGEYVITPVEIVVGKRRNVCGIRRERQKDGAVCPSDPNLWKPLPSPTARERSRIRRMVSRFLFSFWWRFFGIGFIMYLLIWPAGTWSKAAYVRNKTINIIQLLEIKIQN